MNKIEAVEVAYISQSLESHLTEITQTKNVRFAYLYPAEETGKLTTFHPLVKCRDYLSDVLHFKAVNLPASIYGFSLTPETNHINLKRLLLLVQVPKGSQDSFIQNFPFIQELEQKEFNIAPCKLFSVKGNATRFVIDADPFWLNCTQLVSLMTFLCRCSLYLDKPTDNWMEVVAKFSGIDGEYMRILSAFHADIQLPFFSKLDYSKSETPSGFPKNACVSWVHDTGGFLTFITRGDHMKEQYSISAANHFPHVLQNDLIKQMQVLTNI